MLSEVLKRVAAGDRPLVAQFGAKAAGEFGRSIELIAPYVDAVDLNCGCPQRWALEEGIGASLIDPDLEGGWPRLLEIVEAGIRAGRAADSLPIAVKMRLLPSVERTVELARRLEGLGVAWLTVHGRTKRQKSSDPVDMVAIRAVREHVQIPVVANGDVFSLEGAVALQQATGANGIMAARGLLENPGLFAGHRQTPWEAVQSYLGHAVAVGTPTPILHHHVSLMTASVLGKAEHRLLNALANTSTPSIVDYLEGCRQRSATA